MGAKVYLCKPINDEALLAAIGDAIGGVSAEHAADDVIARTRRNEERRYEREGMSWQRLRYPCAW